MADLQLSLQDRAYLAQMDRAFTAPPKPVGCESCAHLTQQVNGLQTALVRAKEGEDRQHRLLCWALWLVQVLVVALFLVGAALYVSTYEH